MLKTFLQLSQTILLLMIQQIKRGPLWETGDWVLRTPVPASMDGITITVYNFRRALLRAEAGHPAGQRRVRGPGPRPGHGHNSSVFQYFSVEMKCEHNRKQCCKVSPDTGPQLHCQDCGLWTRNNFIQFIKIMYTDTSARTLRKSFCRIVNCKSSICCDMISKKKLVVHFIY